MSGTYIRDPERPQAGVEGSERSVLADTLGAEGLDSAVDDLARHGRHDELDDISDTNQLKEVDVRTLAIPISLRAPFAFALSIYEGRLSRCYPQYTSEVTSYLQCSTEHEQARRLDLCARLGNVRNDGACDNLSVLLINSTGECEDIPCS